MGRRVPWVAGGLVGGVIAMLLLSQASAVWHMVAAWALAQAALNAMLAAITATVPDQVPVGLRGLVLAALFGAIQSTINSVLNSTATVVTLDIYRRLFRPGASDRHLVNVGMITSVAVLLIAMVLAGFISRLGSSLFVYIQTLYAFFAPPFSAVFLLGILWRRINAPGATIAVFFGFALGIAMKLYVQYVPAHPGWIEPFGNQAAINWTACVLICVAASLLTGRPPADKVTDQLIFNWRRLNILEGLGSRWYTSVVTWWGLFVLVVLVLIILCSPLAYR